MLDMLTQTLEAEGYQVVPARDGAEGIKKLADGSITLVLTDLKLPKGRVEVLNAVGDNPLLPVIVATVRYDRDRGQGGSRAYD
jgi:DNA-binding response OmpR family regulator